MPERTCWPATKAMTFLEAAMATTRSTVMVAWSFTAMARPAPSPSSPMSPRASARPRASRSRVAQADSIIDGGGGSGTWRCTLYAAAAFISLLDGFAADGFGGTHTLVGIENVLGSAFDDQITGDDNANVLDGGDGHDHPARRPRQRLVPLQGGNGDDFCRARPRRRHSRRRRRVRPRGFTERRRDRGRHHRPAHSGHRPEYRLAGHGHVVSASSRSACASTDNLHGDGGDNFIWGGSDSSRRDRQRHALAAAGATI